MNYPYSTHVTEKILLPPDSGAFTVYKPAEVDSTVAGIEYHRNAEVTGNRFTVEEKNRIRRNLDPCRTYPELRWQRRCDG